MKKKKKKICFENIQIIQDKLNNKHDNLPTPYKFETKKINSNSWFQIYQNDFLNINNNDLISNLIFNAKNKIHIDNPDNNEQIKYKSNSIQIYPNDKQKEMLDKWIEIYRLMMNKTIKYYKTELFNKNKLNTNFRDIRTNILYDYKQKLIKQSEVNDNTIYSHTLDYAIKDITTNIKSALTNLRKHNIDKFRIRYIKKNKPIQIIKFESSSIKFNNNKLIFKSLGEMKCEQINFNIDCDFIIMKKYNRYYLQVPIETKVSNKETNKIIGLDSGVRTFLTGYNQESTVDICTNFKETIIVYLKKIDKIKSEIPNNNRNKREAIGKRHFKIKNIVKELHWKTINYLTNNYDEIIMGNISTKSILANKKTDKMTKRCISSLNFYKFKDKLKYKCSIKNKTIKIVDESFTSKMCSDCGNLNQRENKTKTFKCQNCNLTIDRDYNGAKNIFILGTKIERL